MPNKTQLPSISGLRALSVITVVLFHLSDQFQDFFYEQPNFLVNTFIRFISDGYVGVNMFFVISGFLITLLLLEEEKNTGSISVKKFYIRRSLRIFPAYYFMLYVYLILQLLGVLNISSSSWLTAITYTKYFNWELDTLTAHAWSLSVEEQFYLVWPLIFLCGNKLRTYVPIILILAVAANRVFLHFHEVAWMNNLTIFLRVDAIAIGCLLAIYKDRILQIPKKYWRITFYFSCLLLLFLRPSIRMIEQVPFLKAAWLPIGTTFGAFANFLYAIILLYSVYGPHGIWFRFLNCRIANFVGKISYSIYLWHVLFMSLQNVEFLNFPINLLITLMVAIASYYFIEKPFLNLKSRF
jgi:peptidoglycan/LPS O-acetylase OafA/YrhL